MLENKGEVNCSVTETDLCLGYRRGKWSHEEESYANGLMFAFKNGLVSPTASEGKTLRCYLALKLNCVPMRISKKFPRYEGLGVRFFNRPGVTQEQMTAFQAELSILREKYLEAERKKVIRRNRSAPPLSSSKSERADSGYEKYPVVVSDIEEKLDDYKQSSAAITEAEEKPCDDDDDDSISIRVSHSEEKHYSNAMEISNTRTDFKSPTNEDSIPMNQTQESLQYLDAFFTEDFVTTSEYENNDPSRKEQFCTDGIMKE
mmetsp:Transcript_28217/g.28508  ORF Transcript_28217/g.28508 Transcript_28217/m.28508 type:complete len:260 (+) Transcript_28217:49-828(+)|eukprot:CAMPEP_0182419802 /NCGR_PEP_ID=MMETSP1167-20130531/4167_1 /TAXON_ID=2988 /ORGANISM="Mallomonas Sp, Strain CCMP3275" /LENGTH=259 /DNA_ID=CAMNT_0024594903 /DNA_START=42 /DNA_END=821 /DNA_ORIENTATION=+